MLVRIRTNIATWRIKVPDNASLKELKNIVLIEHSIPFEEQDFEEISSDHSDDESLASVGVKHGDLLSLKGRLEKKIVKTSYVDENGVLIAAGTTVIRVKKDDESDDKLASGAGSDRNGAKSTARDEAKDAKSSSSSHTSVHPAVYESQGGAFGYGMGEFDQQLPPEDGDYFDPQCVPDPDMFNDLGGDDGLEQVRPPDAEKTENLLGQEPGDDIAYQFARHLNSRVSLDEVLGESAHRLRSYQRDRMLNPAAASVESFEDIMRQMGRNPLHSHFYGSASQAAGAVPPGAPARGIDTDISSPVEHAPADSGAGALSPASRRVLKAAGLTDEEIDLSYAAQLPGALDGIASASSSVTRSSHAASAANSSSSLAQRKIVEKSVSLLPNENDGEFGSGTGYSFVSSSARESKEAGGGRDPTWQDVGSDDDEDDTALAQALALSMQLEQEQQAAEEKGSPSSRTRANTKSRSHSISGQDKAGSSSAESRSTGDRFPIAAEAKRSSEVNSRVQEAVNRINSNRASLSAAGAKASTGLGMSDLGDGVEDSLEIALMKAELLSLGFPEEEVREQVEAHKRLNIELGRSSATAASSVSAAGAKRTPHVSPAAVEHYGYGMERVPTEADGDYGPPVGDPGCQSGVRCPARTSAEERRDRIRERIGFNPRALDGDGVVVHPARSTDPPPVPVSMPTVAGDDDDEDLAALMEIAIQESLREP